MCEAQESVKLSCTTEDVNFVKSCANCINYGWPQPTRESRLLRCSKCKFISYCSMECQQEHWVKVHKQHCKYLAELKVMPQSRHEPSSCPGCLKQTEIGLEEMANEDNPSLGCPLASFFVPLVSQPDFEDGGKTSAPLPFKLGEMSGQFLTKAEHTVSLLMHLLHKMKLIKHAAWTIHPETIEDMYSHVSNMRQIIWDAYIYANPGQFCEKAVEVKLTSPPMLLSKLLALTGEIDEKLATVMFMDCSVFKPWDTFKLLLNILSVFTTDFMRKDAESVGLPEMSEAVLMLKVTSAQFSDMWGKVLDSMPGNLVPYKDLLQIVSGGQQLSQVCFGCSKDITVSQVLFHGNNLFSNKAPFIFESYIAANFCGDPNCFLKVEDYDMMLVNSYVKTGLMALGSRCDNCALPGNKGKIHRCTKCLTKQYCGAQCRDEDWKKVHKLVCRKGDERKMKGGKQEREKEGTKQVDEFVKFMKNKNLSEEDKLALHLFEVLYLED